MTSNNLYPICPTCQKKMQPVQTSDGRTVDECRSCNVQMEQAQETRFIHGPTGEQIVIESD